MKNSSPVAVSAEDCVYSRICIGARDFGKGGGVLVPARTCALGGKQRLKTGSYAARRRKRAGRVRLEQRPV